MLLFDEWFVMSARWAPAPRHETVRSCSTANQHRKPRRRGCGSATCGDDGRGRLLNARWPRGASVHTLSCGDLPAGSKMAPSATRTAGRGGARAVEGAGTWRLLGARRGRRDGGKPRPGDEIEARLEPGASFSRRYRRATKASSTSSGAANSGAADGGRRGSRAPRRRRGVGSRG